MITSYSCRHDSHIYIIAAVIVMNAILLAPRPSVSGALQFEVSRETNTTAQITVHGGLHKDACMHAQMFEYLETTIYRL